MTKDQILGSLPALDDMALQAVIAAASAVLAGRPTPTAPNINKPQAWLYEALTATLSVTYAPSWHQTKVGKQFAQKSKPVLAWFEKNFSMDNRVMAQALMRWSFELVARNIKEWGMPLSTALMVTYMDKIPELFGQEFPGYIEAGLAGKIAEQIGEREPYA